MHHQIITWSRLIVLFVALGANTILAQQPASKWFSRWGAEKPGVWAEWPDPIPGLNERQVVQVVGNSSTSSTFTLTYSGQTTAPIAVTATEAVVQAALENLSNIGVGDVQVTSLAGSPNPVFIVDFDGALANTDVPQITAAGMAAPGVVLTSTAFSVSDDTPLDKWSVVPLDFQNGLDLSMDVIPPSSEPWYETAAANGDLDQKAHAWTYKDGANWRVRYYPYQYPIAAFGSGSKGSPMYVGQTYRFALVAGSQSPFIGNSDLLILIYNKTTGAVEGETSIDLPNIPGAGGSTGEWNTFAQNGYQTSATSFASSSPTAVLETSVQFVATGVEWEKWGAPNSPFSNVTTYPLIITHRALSKDYGFIVAYKSSFLMGSLFAMPYTAERNGSSINLSSAGAHGYAYAMDFDESQPWHSTLLQTPHFNGKPLPPSYIGKTPEEIEHEAAQPEFDFGDLFEGIRWTSLVNLLASGGGSGGTELAKVAPGVAGPWDATAVSEKVIYGDGLVQCRFRTGAIANLSVGPAPLAQAYGFQANANQVQIIQNGVLAPGFTPIAYTENDVFTIQRLGVLVRFYKNGEPIFTSSSPSLGKLQVNIWASSMNGLVLGCRYKGATNPDLDNDGMEDVRELALVNLNATDDITNVEQLTPGGDFDNDGSSNLQEFVDETDAASPFSKSLPVTWVSKVNTTSQDLTGALKKTGGSDNLHDADAISSLRLIGDGKVDFRVRSGSHLLLGFNITNTSRDYTDLNYAWHPQANGSLTIYEGATVVGTFGTWDSNTRLSIRRVGDTVIYVKDGIGVHASTIKTRQPLIIDTTFILVGSEVTECRYITGDNDGDEMADNWEVAQLGAGATPADVANFQPSADPDSDGATNLQEFQDGTLPFNALSRMEAVVWTAHRNTQSIGTNGGLKKVAGGTDWIGDAVATKRILGDGAVEYIPGQTNMDVFVGLTLSNDSGSYTDLDYGFHANGSAGVYVYENGTQVASLGSYSPTSRFRIERTGDTVRYYLDKQLVYTSAKKAVGALVVDSAFYALNNTFLQCRYSTGDSDNDGLVDAWEVAQLPAGAGYSEVAAYSGAADTDGDGVANSQEEQDGTDPNSALSKGEVITWTGHVNTATQGTAGGLRKTSGTNNLYDADAISTKKLYGDGRVIFKAAAGAHFLLGFNVTDVNQEWTDLDYAWHPQSGGALGIYEYGAAITTVGTWNTNTVLAIERVGDTVRYWKDGVVVYVSATKTTSPLIIDTAFYTVNSTIAEARYVTKDLDGDEMPDAWELAQLSPGATLTDLQNYLASGDLDGDGVTNLQECLDGTKANSALSKMAPIVWTNLVNTATVGSNGGLRKSAGAANAYDADAESNKKILGDGAVTFKTLPGTYVLLGFNTFNASRDYTDLDHAILTEVSGVARVYEGGTYVKDIGSCNANTVFRIERTGSVVTYRKDGQVVHVSQTPSMGPVVIDTTFANINLSVSDARYDTGDGDNDGMADVWELAQLSPGAGLTDVQNYLATVDQDGDGRNNLQEFQDGTNPANALSKAEAIVWTSHVNTTSQGTEGGLKKTAGGAAYDADAISTKLMRGDGRATFQAVPGSRFLLGFNNNNANRSFEELDYAVFFSAAGVMDVYELGVLKANLGSWDANTVASIERVGSTVRYWKNGALAYTSATASSGALFVDTSFFQTNSEIANARLLNGDLDDDTLPDSWELAQLPSGADYSALIAFGAAADSDSDGVTNQQEYLDGTDADDVQSRFESVVWVREDGTQEGVAGRLIKMGAPTAEGDPSGNYTGAVGEKIVQGDGRMKFRFELASKYAMAGFSVNNRSTIYDDIEYGIYAFQDNTLHVFESGADRGTFGNYTTSDEYEVRREGSVVSYWKNGAKFYTSTVPSNRGMVPDTSIFSMSAGLSTCRVQGATYATGTNEGLANGWLEPVNWINHDGATEGVTGSLWRSGTPSATGDATGQFSGAVSQKTIPGSGRIWFRFAQTNLHVDVGLSKDEADKKSTKRTDLDYAIAGDASGRLHIYESGTDRGDFGPYTADDILEIRRDSANGGVVSYWKNNVKLHDSAVPTTSPLFADAAINSLNGKVAECRIEGAASDNNALDSLALAEQATTELLTLDSSPELRTHPILDNFVDDMGRNPMALANFVLNDIELTDAVGYNDRGEIYEASLNPPGVNRGALAVLMERQGSPVEQCALLVYLLRRAGYPATYVFPATNSMTLLDGTVSKLLRCQVSGALKADGISDVPHEIPVNYPWVAVCIDGAWIHIFPWMKDTEIKEGLNMWDYMPAEVNTPLKWTRAYVFKNPAAYDSQSANESPLGTLLRKFEAHLQANHPGKGLHQFGVSAVDRKHYFTRWEDMPRPWNVDPSKTPTLLSRLDQMPGVFDTIEIQIRGVAANGTSTDLKKIGPLRTLDFHNRRTIVTSNDSGLTVTMEPFRPGTTATSDFSNEPALINRQQTTVTSAVATHPSFEFLVSESRHRYIQPIIGPIEGENFEHFLHIAESSNQTTLPVKRWDVSAFCPNAGRVTTQMLRVHAEESWKNNNAPTPSASLAREIIAFTMGMTYHQRFGENERQILDLLNLSRVSVRGFGFGTIGAKLQGGSYVPVYPVLDIFSSDTAYIGGKALRPDAGGQHILLSQEYYGLDTLEGSALEHLTIRKFFPEENTDAISTVDLLHRIPTNDIVELTLQNFTSKGEEDRTFVHPVSGVPTTKKIREWAGSHWTAIQEAFLLPENGEADFVRVLMTPKPVSGAGNNWIGVGTLILGRNFASALIGQRLNGGVGNGLGGFSISNWPQTSTITFNSGGLASLIFNNPATTPNSEFLISASSIENSIRGVNAISSGTTVMNTFQFEEAVYDYVYNTYGSSPTSSQQAALVTSAKNNGNVGGGQISAQKATSVADPVNTLTGEFYVDTLDLSLAGGAMPLQIRRNYSSRTLVDNDFGYGWKASLMPYLVTDGNNDEKIHAAEMDGNVIVYTRVGATNRWNVTWQDNPELTNTEHGRLHHNYIEKSVENGNTIYRLFGHDGSVREYQVRVFPVTSGSTTWNRQRPYLRRWYDHAGNYYDFTFYNTPGTADYGHLRRISCSNGTFAGFLYDVNGHITEIFTSDGRRIHYRYNDDGDLSEVIRPDGSFEKYEYARQEEEVNTTTHKKEWISTHLMIKEVKPEGRVIVNEYEMDSPTKYATSGRVTRQFSNVGKASTPTPTPVDQPVPVAYANEPVAESYEPRLSTRFNYANLVTNTTTKKSTGFVEIFDAYDRKSEYHYVDNQLVKIVDPLGYSSITEYYPDSDSQTDPGGYRRSVKRSVDKMGLITDYKYDANGNPVEVSVTGDLDGNPNTVETAVSTREYNTRHMPVRIVEPHPTTGTSTGRVTEITYGYALDPYLPTQTTVLLGSTVISKSITVYGEVGAGIVPFAKGVVLSTSKGEDGDMAVTTWSYDRAGLPTIQTQYSGETGSVAPNVVTRYRYNERKELLESEDAAGRKRRYAYDNMGRRIWEEWLDETGKQVSWSYVYYNQNGEVEWTDGPRYAPEDYTFARYDGIGRMVEQVLWRSRAKTDGTGVEEVPGAELYSTTKKAYSLFGDLLKTTDPHGNTTRLKYDSIGRPIESHTYQGDWQNGGAVLASTYTTYHSELDGNNIPRHKAVTVKSPTGGLTKTYHTQAGKPWKQENPDGTVLEWEYYMDGRPKKEPLSPHTYVLYTYNDAARQVTKAVKNAAGSTLGQPQVTITNSRGQVISATDAAGYQVTTAYDKLGRPLRVTQPHSPGTPNPTLAVGHIYDAAGIVATNYNAINEKTVTTHDAAGRPVLAQIIAANGSVVSQTSTDYEPSLPGQTAKIKGQHAVQTISGVGGEAIKSSVVFTDTAGTTVLEVKQVGGYVRTDHDMVANVTRTYVTGNLDGAGGLDTTVTSTSFDGLGRPLVTTMPDGAKVTMFYDYVLDGGNNIVGSIVERRMPSAAQNSVQAPTVGGLVEYQKFDAAGRVMEKSLRAGGSSTRNYIYHYHPANAGKDGGLLHYFEQQVAASSYRQHIYTYDDWRRTDTYTCGTQGQSDYVKRTLTYGDPRSLITALREDTLAGYTIVNRVYDEQSRISDEKVDVDGTVVRHLTNSYDTAGRRDSLAIGNTVSRLGNATGGTYAFGWQANGKLTSVSTGGQTFNYAYQTNGLVASRSNPWRSYNVTNRDARGRVTGATTHLTGATGAVLTEGLTWLDDNRQESYTAQRSALPGDPVAAWTDERSYTYDLGRRRLTNETFIPSQGGASNLSFAYDQGQAGLGVRTKARQGTGTASDFQSTIDGLDNGATNAFARVVREQVNHSARDFSAEGTALGAQKVSVSLANPNSHSSRITSRLVNYSGPLDNQGAWSAPLRLWPGSYTLHAAAEHPSGTFTDTSESSFVLQREMLAVQNSYDEEGNMTGRIWTAGATTVRTQTLTWDGQGRLIAAMDRDSSGHGYDWNARYDGLGRRIATLTQTVRSNAALGAAFAEGSWYDPLVEFLEIAVETREVSVANTERRSWKVHGTDADGTYGGLQGIGGLEAVIEETSGSATALVDDYYGHIVANVEASTLSARWSVTRSQAYGPAPDSPTFALFSGATLVEATAWRGRRVDATGFHCLGMRYYEATSGRFLSPDPLGHGASMDLYSLSGGDPINFVDPTGRIRKGSAGDPLFGGGTFGRMADGAAEDIASDSVGRNAWGYTKMVGLSLWDAFSFGAASGVSEVEGAYDRGDITEEQYNKGIMVVGAESTLKATLTYLPVGKVTSLLGSSKNIVVNSATIGAAYGVANSSIDVAGDRALAGVMGVDSGHTWTGDALYIGGNGAMGALFGAATGSLVKNVIQPFAAGYRGGTGWKPTPFNECFPAGTRVLMADGSTKPIELVVEGDHVWADNPEDEAPPATRRVAQLHRNWTLRLIHITVDIDLDGNGDSQIRATGEHPFWTEGRGWVAAKDLVFGDQLRNSYGSHPTVISAVSVLTTSETYNLSVEGVNTFFALAGETALLVHNTEPIFPLEVHPYGEFRKFPNDNLVGHEMLQNAWLRENLSAGAFKTFKQQNPSLALPTNIHVEMVNPLQRKAGLWTGLAGQSAYDNIRANIKVLEKAGIPRDVIAEQAKAAWNFAKTLPCP